MALASERMTARRDGYQYNDPVAAGAVIYRGALCALNAAGYLVPGATAADLTVRGVAERTVDNSAGNDGDLSAGTRKIEAHFKNSGDIDRTHIGQDAYIVDDETVSADNTGKSRAGRITDVDDDGVWLDTRV